MIEAQLAPLAIDAVPVAWFVVFVGALLLAMSLQFSSSWVSSLRLRVDEARFDVNRLSARRLRRIEAARIPGRRGSWNALVVEEDGNRIKAQIVGDRITRKYVAWSLVVVVLLFAASLLSLTRLNDEAVRTNSFGASLAVRVVGLVFILAFAWYAIPLLTLWRRQSIQRARTPFAWRLLSRGHVIKTLSTSTNNRWTGHEAPRDGRITAAAAARLLSTIEAEIVESFAKPRNPSVGDLVVWRKYDLPRVSRVLDDKARLIGGNRSEIGVEEVYDWIDLVVDELVIRRTRPRVLAAAAIPEDLLEPRAQKHARKVLWLGMWRSPAGLFTSLLALALGMTGVTVLYTGAQTVFGADAELAGWTNTLVTMTLSAIVTHLVTALLRSGAT